MLIHMIYTILTLHYFLFWGFVRAYLIVSWAINFYLFWRLLTYRVITTDIIFLCASGSHRILWLFFVKFWTLQGVHWAFTIFYHLDSLRLNLQSHLQNLIQHFVFANPSLNFRVITHSSHQTLPKLMKTSS